MFVDASAFLAILLLERDADRFSDAIADADRVLTSPLAMYETVTGLMRAHRLSRAAAEESMARVIDRAGIEIVAITGEISIEALGAFEKYGKGRGHKAQLNMGDCFAYACAKSLGVPLLYKGNDFAKTDLA